MNEEERRGRPAPNDGEDAEKTQEERANSEARGASWLLLGGVFGWRAVKSVVNFRRRSNKLKSIPAAEVTREASGLEGPAGKLLVGGAEAGWKAVQLSARAISKVIEEHTPGKPPGEISDLFDRENDTNLDKDEGVNVLRRERRGTFLVICAIVVMFAAGIGFLFIYWTGGNNLLLGGNLALFLAGIGCAMVFWAQFLTVRRQAVAPREPSSSSPSERAAATRAFEAGAQDVGRRRLLRWMGGFGAAFAATIVVSLMKSMGFPPSTALDTRVWSRGQRLVSLDKTPVSVNSLQPGSMMLVFPENAVGSEKTQTVLVRVREELLRLPPERKSWAPQGYLAYSRVCTHAGCAVGMYETTTHLLMCPCHQSTFDVLDGAQPTGGPAARPLPQVPLYVDGAGILRAAGGFSEPPGPGFWGMP
jgi:ubiquinol-cytochrome c reductase iron-sulfur subunit